MKKFSTSIILILLLGLIFNPIKSYAASPDEVLAYMNAERAAVGLPALIMNEDLVNVASMRATECASNFSHIRPNGKAWYTISDLTCGENLAHAVNNNQQKPENVVYAWMLSPTHKANVIRSNFTYCGIAYYTAPNGDIYIVCEFN